MSLIGQTGADKTFLAQAIGLNACARGRSVLFESSKQASVVWTISKKIILVAKVGS